MDNYLGLEEQSSDQGVAQYVDWLNKIKSAAEDIWKIKMMPWFTNHDTKHSEEIIYLLEQILLPLKNYTDCLKPNELFVLIASAYLHDIGMQDMKVDEKAIETLSSSDYRQIRKQHAQKSFAIIMKNTRQSLARDDFHLPVIIEEEYLPYIAYIAKGHSSEYFAEVVELFEDPSFNIVGNRQIRSQLLTALLMIADELDLSRKRINFEDTSKYKLSALAATHWYKHYYVNSVAVRDKRVYIDMIFPEKSEHYGLFKVLIKEKLEEQIKKINPILRKSTNGILYFEEENSVVISEKINEIFAGRSLPDDVYHELKSAVKKNTATSLKYRNITSYGIPEFPNFIERKQVILEIEKHLERTPITILYGEPGIGLTYIASSLAQKMSRDCQVIWVDKNDLTFSDLMLIIKNFLINEGNDSFTNIYEDHDIDIDGKIAALINILRGNKYAIFIDNFKTAQKSDFQLFLKRFNSYSKDNKIILIDQLPLSTSFDASLLSSIMLRAKKKIKGFEKDEAAAFLNERSKEYGIIWSDTDINEVYEKTSGHPLALNLIIKWVSLGVSVNDVLTQIVKFDNNSGAQIRRKLLEGISENLCPEEIEVLQRFSVLKDPVSARIWSYLDVREDLRYSLIQRGLIEKIGQSDLHMNPLMREFWYAGYANPRPAHCLAAKYYWDSGTSSPLPELNVSAYQEAFYHYRLANQHEKCHEVLNEYIMRLHQKEKIPSEQAIGLNDWFLELNEDIVQDKPWLLLEKGKKTWPQDMARAKEILERAIAEFELQKNMFGAAIGLYFIGKYLQIKQERIPEALKALERSLTIAGNHIYDNFLQIRILGKMISCLVDTGNYSQAREKAETAYKLALSSKDEFGFALICYKLAKIERRDGNFQQAINFLDESKTIFEKLNNGHRVSRVLSRLGTIQSFQGDYINAAKNLERAIEIKKSLNDNFGIAKDLDYLADVYVFRGDYEEALEIYKQSLNLKESITESERDLYGIIKTYNNLGRVYTLLGNPAEGERKLKESEDKMNAHKKQYLGLNATRLNNLGDIRYRQGNYYEALQLFHEALNSFTAPNPEVPVSRVRAIFSLGRVYVETRNIELAFKSLNTALPICRRHALLYYEALTCVYLARLLTMTGKVSDRADEANALFYLNTAKDISRKIGADHVLMLCLETEGAIKEFRVLNDSNSFPRDNLPIPLQQAMSLIKETCRYYDDALKIPGELKANFDVSVMKVKKHLWSFTVKFLGGHPISKPDDIYGLLQNEPFAMWVVQNELIRIINMMHCYNSKSVVFIANMAKRYLNILSPIALLMGLNSLREEADKRAFSFLYPAKYQEISQLIEIKLGDSKNTIRKIKNEVQKKLNEANINAMIGLRVKEYYSIYKKSTMKKVSLDKILDLIGFRIITETQEECYQVLSIIREMGTIYQGEGVLAEPVRDYIQLPKKLTGYRSIHINIWINKIIVEFQIRTMEMHLAAETGFSMLGLDQASHRHYKDAKIYRNKDLLSKAYSDRRISRKVMLSVPPNQIATLGEIIHNNTGLDILNIDISKENSNGRFHVVLHIEFGLRSKRRTGQKASEKIDFMVEKLINNVKLKINSSLAQIVVQAEEIKGEIMSIDEKANLIKELGYSSSKYMYVITPKCDVIKLPHEATVLDFAFYIHTDLGYRAKAARVNGVWVPLDYKIKTGDTVEIIQSSKPKPSRDWLSIVTTRPAQRKTRQWLAKNQG